MPARNATTPATTGLGPAQRVSGPSLALDTAVARDVVSKLHVAPAIGQPVS